MKDLEEYFLDDERITELNNFIGKTVTNFELVPLQTCNRMELYFAAEHFDVILKAVKAFFSISDLNFSNNFYCLSGNDCVWHLMEVAGSLDSVILGESQILGQVRDAYLKAKDKGLTSKILNRLFEQTVKTGKRVRSETGISKGAVSISQASVELGRKVFRSLEGAKLILLGAGEMGRLTLDHLANTKARSITVLNRTFERADELANKYDERITVESLDELENLLLPVDMIFAAMNFDGYILKRESIERLMPRRRYKPLFLIDISLPRVFDPDCNKLDNVFQFDIEDLKDVVDKNKQERELQAELANQIIKQEVVDLEFWLSLHQLAPLMQSMNEYKQILVEEQSQKFSKYIDEAFRDAEKKFQIPTQLRHEITEKLEHYSQKSMHNLGGKLHHLIAQLAKNYPRNPLDQQRLQKVIRDAVNISESSVDFDTKIDANTIDNN